jgi:hypothetical protein
MALLPQATMAIIIISLVVAHAYMALLPQATMAIIITQLRPIIITSLVVAHVYMALPRTTMVIIIIISIVLSLNNGNLLLNHLLYAQCPILASTCFWVICKSN